MLLKLALANLSIGSRVPVTYPYILFWCSLSSLLPSPLPLLLCPHPTPRYFLTFYHYKLLQVCLVHSLHSPRISHFSKDSWFLFLENDIRNPNRSACKVLLFLKFPGELRISSPLGSPLLVSSSIPGFVEPTFQLH